MKKVLILSGSPRKNGNSDILCNEFEKGAEQSGNQVEKIRVAEKQVACCKACYGCKTTGKCVINDDMAEILQKIIDCNVLVLASSVYFYSLSAQLKAVIDRTVARWTEVKSKELYFIVTAADGEAEAAKTTIDCFKGYADCIEGAKLKGEILGMGVYEKGEILGKEVISKAYEMGRNV